MIRVSGAISGLLDQTISAVTVPGSAYNPDGSFVYNNLYYRTRISLDNNGLLFTAAQNPGGYWNLWENSPSNYSLWDSAGSYNYPIDESGTICVAATSEPWTLAMMLLGFPGIGFAAEKNTPRSVFAPSSASWSKVKARQAMPTRGNALMGFAVRRDATSCIL